MKSLAPSALTSDRKGILVATLCFVHCVAGPVLLSFAGFASLIGVSEKLEPLFVLSSVAIGTATLIPGYRHKHRRFSCLALFFCGILCLAVLRRFEWLAVPEWTIAAIGAGLIAGAHVLNLRFSKQCECCKSRAACAQPIVRRPRFW
jgi:MerC mercury resistance protein